MTDSLSPCNRFSGKPFAGWEAMVAAMPEADAKLTGKRLRAIQRYLKLDTVDDFGEAVRAERSAASNWLNGYNFPRVPSMALVMELIPGITLDWIYLGVADAMPLGLAIKLQALEEGEKVPPVVPEPASVPKAAARRRAAHKLAT